jgi:PHD/YefM family antitoxin component YafN of YafNO toxin-antitoxin module
MEIVNALTFRKNFGRLLDRVVQKKEPLLIKRMNEPMVVMEPYEVYQVHQQSTSREARILKASERIEEWAKRNAPRLKDVKAADAIRKLRDELK